MKKKLILIGITVLLVVTFTACRLIDSNDSNLENDESNTETEATDEKDIEKETEKIEYEYTEEGIIKPEIAEKVIKETSDKLINTISTKDTETISEFVHPVKGVRFTPYTNVSVEKDIVFNIEKIKEFFNDREVYLWGYYDGRGDEIYLTPSKYYEEFLYTEDFINAEEIGYNEVLSSGNSAENQFEVYENAIVVEYYFSGFNPEFGGADWKSIRLVFEEYEGSWKLVGIINNQWTI